MKQKITKQQITEVLLWLAFGALLATSIPHVAWWFNSYEPSNNWLVGYAMAISIDVVIGWLAYLGREDHKIRTYSFVLGLVVLSWIGNYLFDVTNAPTQAGVWAWSIYQGVTIGQVSPFIVSSIPLLILAYTNMLSTVRKNVVTDGVAGNVIHAVLNGHGVVPLSHDVAHAALSVTPELPRVAPVVYGVASLSRYVAPDVTPMSHVAPDVASDVAPLSYVATPVVPDVAPVATHDTMSQGVASDVASLSRDVAPDDTVSASSVTPVGQLLSQGMTLRQIADMRGVTVRTVQRQLAKERST